MPLQIEKIVIKGNQAIPPIVTLFSTYTFIYRDKYILGGSPTCPRCRVRNTTEHFLLHCKDTIIQYHIGVWYAIVNK